MVPWPSHADAVHTRCHRLVHSRARSGAVSLHSLPKDSALLRQLQESFWGEGSGARLGGGCRQSFLCSAH